jgi:uncharacterized protein (DUF983 family)
MTIRCFLTLRCPVCEKGKLFRGYFDSPERCPECGYFFMRETGYFLPHVPIGYGVTILLSLGSWPFMRYILGIENSWFTLAVMVGVAVFFGIWFIRYSKMLWLALDLYFHPPVAEDFQRRDRHAEV